SATLINMFAMARGDYDWNEFLGTIRNGPWFLQGQGTIDENGKVDVIGMLRIGQHTNVGKFRVLAQIVRESTMTAAYTRPSFPSGPQEESMTAAYTAVRATTGMLPPLEIPVCPPGSEAWAYFKTGEWKQLDADYFNVIRNNPALRNSIIRIECRAQPTALAPQQRGIPQPQLPLPTASQAYTRALREQATPSVGGSTPRGGGYQVSRIGVRGIPESEGLGIPGPYGASPSQMFRAGTYEITGTQVALFDTVEHAAASGSISPDTPGVVGFFNNDYGQNGNKVAGVPDQVQFAEEASAVGGRMWAKVTTKTGSGQTTFGTNVQPGQVGFVAVAYMAEPGWTAAHGGTGPIPSGGPEPQPPPEQPPLAMISAGSKWTMPLIIGSIVVLGVGAIGYALYGTKKGKAVRRLGRIKYRRARRGR
ncbi:MAG: hypothetical protein ACREJC_06035, partial [Tepidisphaeraceae bacterium]